MGTLPESFVKRSPSFGFIDLENILFHNLKGCGVKPQFKFQDLKVLFVTIQTPY